MAHPMFRNTRGVLKMPDSDHPGLLSGMAQYIANAGKESEQANTKNSVQIIALPSESGAPSINYTLELQKATKEQLVEAANYARAIVPDTSTKEGIEKQAELRLQKLQELISMSDRNDWQANGASYLPPAPPPAPTKSWPGAPTPQLPAQAFTYGATEGFDPRAVPAVAPLQGPIAPWLQQQQSQQQQPQQQVYIPANIPQTPPPPTPSWMQQDAQLNKPKYDLRPDASPPSVRVTFWLPNVKFQQYYHHIDIQRAPKTGQPVAIYLAYDNRFTGSTPFLADTIDTVFGLQIGTEREVYEAEATGLIHEFLDYTLITLMINGVRQLS